MINSCATRSDYPDLMMVTIFPGTRWERTFRVSLPETKQDSHARAGVVEDR